MTPLLLSLARNPYAIGVLAVILVGGGQQARVWKAQAGEARAVSESAHRQAAWAASLASGERAAREAVEAAVAREKESEARRKAGELEAAERLRAAAETAARDAADWRRRYREAAENDPSCAAWSAEKVKCPTD